MNGASKKLHLLFAAIPREPFRVADIPKNRPIPPVLLSSLSAQAPLADLVTFPVFSIDLFATPPHHAEGLGRQPWLGHSHA